MDSAGGFATPHTKRGPKQHKSSKEVVASMLVGRGIVQSPSLAPESFHEFWKHVGASVTEPVKLSLAGDRLLARAEIAMQTATQPPQ